MCYNYSMTQVKLIKIADIGEVKRENEGDLIKVTFYGEPSFLITDQAAKRLVSDLQTQIYYNS